MQPKFQASNPICGEVQFTAELIANATSEMPADPVALNGTSGYVKFFNNDGTFKVQTSDIGLLGSYEIKVSASLVNYPTVTTITKTTIPINFKLCDLNVNTWSLPKVNVPYATNLTHKYEEPTFQYSNE